MLIPSEVFAPAWYSFARSLMASSSLSLSTGLYLVAEAIESTLEEELSIKEDELAQTKEELKQAKEDEEQQYESMKLRIRFMYEKGDSAMLTTILESKSIAELLNRVEYVNQVYDYDRNLLTEYKNTKEQVAALTEQQKQEIAALEQKQQEFQVAEENYRTTIAKKQGEVANFGEMLAAAQALAAQYQDTINAQNVIIAQENERIERERQQREQAEQEPGGDGSECSGEGEQRF